MKFNLPADSRLFATAATTDDIHYDQVILPGGMKAMTAFYARRKVNHEWYTLMAWGVDLNDSGQPSTITFEDPHKRGPQTEGILYVNAGLEMPEYNDARYQLQPECPATIDAFHLPVDARIIRFLGYTEDLTKRLVLVDSRFYLNCHLWAYAGSSFDNPLPPLVLKPNTTALVTDESAVYELEDGSETLLSFTGAPCLYRGEEYFRVDPAAYTFREAFGGLILERS